MPVDTLTRAALLARWTHVAQAAKSLPPGGEGDRWRRAVPALVALDALAHALAELHGLPESEHALGQDRAEVLIGAHAGALHALWRGEDLPGSVRDWIDDARRALRSTREGGIEFRAGAGFAGLTPERWAGAVEASAVQAGDLWVLSPGEVVGGEVPIAFLRGPRGRRPEAAVVARLGALLGAGASGWVPGMRQVYRCGAGQPDVVAAMDETLPAGRPLLAGVVERGRRIGG